MASFARAVMCHTRVHARAGTALILALVMLLVLDCVVIGALQLSILERRMAEHTALALRLRLAAEGAAHLAMLTGAAAMDSLHIVHLPHPLPVRTTPDGIETRVTLERVAPELFLFRAVASQRQPGSGRAVAALVAAPPAWPMDLPVAAAAASAAGPVTIRSSGFLTAAAAELACEAEARPPALLVMDAEQVQVHAGGRVYGTVERLQLHQNMAAHVPRLVEYVRIHGGPDLRLFERDTSLTLTGNGVVIAAENLALAAGSTFSGVVIAGVGLSIRAGAAVNGAVFAGTALDIGGQVAFDGCAARAAIDRSGLGTPRAAGGRARIPAF